jgi:aminoglycoside phosphotransferase (APT) family kinase protein
VDTTNFGGNASMVGPDAIPPADVRVDVALVRALLDQQAPQFASLPLTVAAEGWDNVMVRAGEDLVVRLPRRELAGRLFANEVTWAPLLAPGLPLPIPVPRFVGRPGSGYPYPWAVSDWLPGTTAEEFSATERDAYAPQLARFLAAFHRPVSAVIAMPDDASPASTPASPPVNPVRGVPVAARSQVWWQRLVESQPLLAPGVSTTLERMIHTAEDAPEWNREPVWVHGDPHLANVLAEAETTASGTGETGTRVARLTGVVDLGDVTVGDPASDLAEAARHFTPAGVEAFRTTYEAEAEYSDQSLWDRARGWTVHLLLVSLTHQNALGRAAREALARLG